MDWRYLLFGFEGRISRKPYWIGTCVILAVSLLSYFVQSRIGDPRPMLLVDFALLYPDFAVMVKRARDRDMSPMLPALSVLLAAISNALEFFGLMDKSSTGLYDLLLIPFVLLTVYLIIVLGFFKGTPGPNRFGPDPLEPRTS